MSCSASTVSRGVAMRSSGYFGLSENSERGVHLVVIDTETTGVFSQRGLEGPIPRVVQLGIYIPLLGLVFEEKIDPQMPIPRAAMMVHGICDADVRHARVFQEVWNSGLQFISSSLPPVGEVVLVGHNLKEYDLKLLKLECTRVGVEYVNVKSCDTLKLARILFAQYADRSARGFYTLGSLVSMLGIDEVKAHDASGDVQVNAQLFERFVDGIDPDKIDEALLSAEPEEKIAVLINVEGRFRPEREFEHYIKACELAIPLAKACFSCLLSDDFFEVRNLAALLDLVVFDSDRETQILWRIFQELTQGVKRKELREALNNEDSLQAVYALLPEGLEVRLKAKLDRCYFLRGVVLDVGLRFFSAHGVAVWNWSELARNLGVPLKRSEASAAEAKRIFMKLTRGLFPIDVEAALREADPVFALLKLIEECKALHSILPQKVTRKRAR
jgi:DNA polymerase III epsilon subunit-like protein